MGCSPPSSVRGGESPAHLLFKRWYKYETHVDSDEEVPELPLSPANGASSSVHELSDEPIVSGPVVQVEAEITENLSPQSVVGSPELTSPLSPLSRDIQRGQRQLQEHSESEDDVTEDAVVDAPPNPPLRTPIRKWTNTTGDLCYRQLFGVVERDEGQVTCRALIIENFCFLK